MNIQPQAPRGQVKTAPAQSCTDPLTDKDLRRIPWLSPRAVELYVYLARIVQAKRRDREIPFALVGFPAMSRELGCSIRSAKVAMDELKGFVVQKVRLPGGKSQYVRQQVGYPLVRGWRLARRPGRKLVRVCSYALLEVRVDQLVEMSALLSSNLTCPPPPAPPESALVSAPVSALLSSNLFLASTGIKAAPGEPQADHRDQPPAEKAAAVVPQEQGQVRDGKARFRETAGKEKSNRLDPEVVERGVEILQGPAAPAICKLGDKVAPYENLDRNVQNLFCNLADKAGAEGVELLTDYLTGKISTGKVDNPKAYLRTLLVDYKIRGELAVEEWRANCYKLGYRQQMYRRREDVRTTNPTTTAPMRRAGQPQEAAGPTAPDPREVRRQKVARWQADAARREAAALPEGVNRPQVPGTSPAGPQDAERDAGLSPMAQWRLSTRQAGATTAEAAG